MSPAATAEDRDRTGGGRKRSAARLGAVQALYQLALNPGLGPEVVIGEFRHHLRVRDARAAHRREDAGLEDLPRHALG